MGMCLGCAATAVQPRTDRRVGLELEAAFLRGVRVAVDGDVGERHPIADEPLAAVEVALQRSEHAVAAAVPLVEPVACLLGPARVREPEPCDGDVRLESYCSKNIHCSTCARRYGSSGTKRVPSPKYQRIAPDSPSARPSSSMSVGTRSDGLSPPSTSGRFERSTTSIVRRSQV